MKFPAVPFLLAATNTGAAAAVEAQKWCARTMQFSRSRNGKACLDRTRLYFTDPDDPLFCNSNPGPYQAPDFDIPQLGSCEETELIGNIPQTTSDEAVNCGEIPAASGDGEGTVPIHCYYGSTVPYFCAAAYEEGYRCQKITEPGPFVRTDPGDICTVTALKRGPCDGPVEVPAWADLSQTDEYANSENERIDRSRRCSFEDTGIGLEAAEGGDVRVATVARQACTSTPGGTSCPGEPSSTELRGKRVAVDGGFLMQRQGSGDPGDDRVCFAYHQQDADSCLHFCIEVGDAQSYRKRTKFVSAGANNYYENYSILRIESTGESKESQWEESSGDNTGNIQDNPSNAAGGSAESSNGGGCRDHNLLIHILIFVMSVNAFNCI